MRADTYFWVVIVAGVLLVEWVMDDGIAQWIALSTVVLFAAVAAVSQQIDRKHERMHRRIDELTEDLEDRIDERIESRLRQLEERQRLANKNR